MAPVARHAGTLVFGGILIGVWLYFVLFGPLSDGWLFWGLVGLGLGGGAFATRYTNREASIAIWIGLGILTGLAIMGALQREDATFAAAALTGVGGVMIGRAVELIRGAQSETYEPAHTEDLA